MASEEELQIVLKLLDDNRPQNVFDDMKKMDHGILAVIRYLHLNNNEVKSKDISDFLVISSARMAKLLQKMEKKNIIIKYDSTSDARITLIKLTNFGNDLAERIAYQFRTSAEKLADNFGIERLTNMFKEMNDFKNIIKESLVISFMEEDDD